MLLLIVAAVLLFAWLGPWRSHSREYWIKAEEIIWNYSPSYPINRMTDEPFGEKELVFLKPGPDRIGRIYRKAVFRSYGPNFGTLLDGPQPSGQKVDDGVRVRRPGSPEEHLGALGPILRAEVGDTIVVHVRNETRFPVSLHPHGVAYDKANEGSGYGGSGYVDGSRGSTGSHGAHQLHGGGSLGNAVSAGGTFTYRWQVPPRSGPGPADPDSIAWPYHSHVNEVSDTSAGLVGAIVIHRRGSLDERRQLPKGVDREFVNLFTVTDENKSLYLETNMREFLGAAPIDSEDEEFVESNLMHGINGFVYGDLPGLTMAEGEHVRWHVMSMGTEIDIHTPHWHGTTLLENGRRLDTTEVFPASSRTLDMTPDRPGMWMLHCHVNDHMEAGMHAMFTVLPSHSGTSSR
ncbi:MAG: multicopper oxidase domain-containing protein [Prochlorococcaceae cyanobacterium]